MVVGNLLALSDRLWRTEPIAPSPDTFHNLIGGERPAGARARGGAAIHGKVAILRMPTPDQAERLIAWLEAAPAARATLIIMTSADRRHKGRSRRGGAGGAASTPPTGAALIMR